MTKVMTASRAGPSAGLARAKLLRPTGTRISRARFVDGPMLGKIFYWLAVLAISLALVIALILFFEARDSSSLDGAGSTPTRVTSA